MTNFYFNLNQIQSNPDGEPTVNRQSRLMSLRGKKAEKEQLSRDCLSLASESPLTCPRPDSLSLVSRQSDLDQVRAISAAFSTRVWKHVAMIFAVLVMSVANIGMAWGATATYVPLGLKTISTDEVVYCTAITAAGDPTTSWVVVPNYGTSSKGYTQITSTTDNGNPQGITDNLASTKSNVAMIQIKKDGNTYSSSKRVIHMHVKGITGVIAHGNTGSANYGLSIAVAEFNNNLSTFPSDITSGVRKSNSGCILIKKDGLDASKEYIVSIYSSGGNIYFYAVEFIAGGGGSTTYSVIYDGNGKTSGSVPTDSNSPYEEGDEVTVLGNTGSLAKTGYTFTGWNTAADGSGTHYDAGDQFDMGTANVTLYAQWELNLSTHEPGKYETAAGSGGYGKTLKTVDGRDFEVYMFNSTTLRAGSATTISDGLSMLTASNGTDVIDGKEGWICVKSTGDAAGSGATQKAEFSVTSGTSNDQKTHYIPISNAGYIKLKVSGYDQFSMVGRDGSTTAGSGKFVVKIDGVSQSLTSTTTDHSVYRFSMTTGTHTIEVTSDGSTACRFRGFSLRLPAAACTAPNHVDVTGRWDRFAGETISLTATAYSSEGTGSPIAAGSITGHQWQKLIGTTWADVTNGTSGGATTTGATSANLQITNCTKDNSGKYRCVVSTGATCSTASATATDGSEGLKVKVFTLDCYNGGVTSYNFTRTGSTDAGTVTVDLAANTTYEFEIVGDDEYYGNGGTINEDVINWVMTSGAGHLKINSGLGGTFSFTMDYGTGGNNSTRGVPELSVTYPRKTIYLTPGVWNSESAKFAIYYFRKEGETTYGNGWTDFLTANDCGMSAEIPQWNGVKVDAVRLKNTCTTPNWTDKWNQTSDITISNYNSIVITGWNEGDYTYSSNFSTPTYTISYAKGGTTATGGAAISGSKADESKTCGVAFTLPSSAVFTATGYMQTGWTTSDGGSKEYELGGTYTTNAAQTFYPVWEVAASLTALECNTLYTPADMLPSEKTISSGWQYDAYGLSGNNKFFIVGNGGDQSTAEADAGIVEIKTGSAVTISGTEYSNYCYFKKAPQMSSTTPTSKAIKFILSGSGSLDVYGKGVLALVKEGGSPTTKDCTSTPSKVTWDNLTAGTYYLYATGTSRYMVAMQFNCCTTPAAPTGFTAGSITSTGATFSITDAGDAASYDIYYSESSTAPTAGTAATTTSTEKTKAVTGLTASTTYYAWVRSVCDADHKSAWVALSGSSFTTTSTPSELTAIEANVLYQAADMANITFTGDDQWFAGLSTNAKFKTYGDGSSTSAKGKTVSSTSITDDIDTKNFTSIAYIMTADNTSSTSDPTKGAIEFITPSTAGYLYLYFENTSSALTLKKKGTSTSLSLSGAKYKKVAVEASTHYFINGAGSNRGLYGIKFIADVTAPTFVSSVPANGATDVATSGTIVLTFNEPLGSVDASKFTLTGATKGTVTIDGSDAAKVNITYTGAENSSTVTLATAAAAVSDVAGNALAAALSDISFTTAAAPSGDCEELFAGSATSTSVFTTTVGSATTALSSGDSFSSGGYSYSVKPNSTNPIVASPKSGSSFAAGDSLIVVVYNNQSGAKTMGFKLGSGTYTTSVASKKLHVFRQKLVASDISAGKVTFTRQSSDDRWVEIIIKHCGLLPSCTTPVIPSLSDQTVCPGSDIAAWDATQTASLETGESASYSWKKKGSETVLATTASFDLGSSAAESQAGTYVVTVTVSADGKASKSASKEVTLTVTAAVEEPSISSNKATVYAGNSVTLTATCGTAGVTWNWYLCANADGTGAGSSLGTSSTYTIASAPAAGTYYYKAVATGTCGSAEHVYTLTVSEASGTCNMMTIFDGSTMSSAPASTSGTESTSGATWTAVGTATEMSSTVSMEYSGKTYTKGWKFTGGVTTSSSRYIQIVIPTGYTGDLVMNGFIGSTSRSVFVATSPTGTLNTSIAYWSPATTNTLYTATTRLSAGTYYICATNAAYLTELSVNVCGTESCTDEKPTATATNNTVCSGSTLTITATGYESDPTSIQWQKKNGESWDNISGATSATYSVASAAAADAGTYRVQVTKGCTRNSNEVTIVVPSEPVFGAVPSSVTVMQTIALSISTVEATDAVSYKWYKSANSSLEAGDPEIGSSKELMKAYADEAIGTPSYYVFCVVTNSCGADTTSAIAVNVTAYVEQDCAVVGSSGEHNTFGKTGSVSSGTYGGVTELHTNSNNKYIYYTAEDGYYFSKAIVNACVGNASDLPTASYSYSTDGGENWTDANLTGMTTDYQNHIINLPASVNAFRVGRRLGDTGTSSSTIYIHEVCFEYTENCTATTITVSSSSVDYEMGDEWSNPTFTLSVAGTLTYSSSNEDIASVDDDGTVTFNGEAGTVTITASYAGGTISATEYCASSSSYTITVSCSSERPKIVPGGTVNMSGCNPSVALNAKMQDGTSDFSPAGTYQWYRDGEAISGATSASYTARQAGIYTVERTYDGCTNVSSNNATITSERVEPEIKHLVLFQYYHVDSIYHETSIMRYRHLFTVKASEEYNSTGRNFKMELSKNGSTPEDKTTSNAFVVKKSADNTVDTVLIDLNKLSGKFAEGDELKFTCKAVDCEHNVSEVYKDSITMHVIDKTPTMALILAGKDGGALNEYEPKNLQKQTGEKTWSGEWPLYTEMKKQYIITPLNGYAPFNKLNYEQYDIIFLTDFPKKSKNATAINNLADLVDYRPMFTFKTHMSGLSKWATKGFTEDPKVPKQSRLRLNIVCYAHPMFEELQTPSIKNQMLRDASDNTQLVYTLLTEGGYEKIGDVKKGIQGFDFSASDNFVTIGLIHYDATAADSVPDNEHVTWAPASADKTLVAAAERQYNPEARMVMFSLNAGAHSKLTETGQNVVLACLEYLLQDVMIKPMADCAYTFDNDEGRGNGKWSVATNWLQEELPGPYQAVKVIAPATVDYPNAKALEVRLIDDGKITIAKNGVLTVQSTIRRKDGSETLPTEEDDIVIETAADGQGALIFNNDRGDSRATVNLYSKGRKDGNNYQFQYIAMPMGRVPVHPYFEGSDIFTYAYTEAGGWERRGYYTDLYAFEGIGVTTRRATASNYTIKGALTSTESQSLDMTYENSIATDKGYNMFGNSWSAPIQISQLRVGNEDANIQKTVYIYVAGKDPDGGPTTSGDKTEVAGKWLAIPFDASGFEGWTGLKVIPAFQAFEIQTNAAATLSLDYDKMVRGGTTEMNAYLRAPKRRTAEHEGIELMVLHLAGGKVNNDLFMFEGEQFSDEFDNGWEATFKEDEEIPTQLYSPTPVGKLAVAALPSLEGAKVNFTTNEAGEYTFTFSGAGNAYYLNDIKEQKSALIKEGNAYVFALEEGDAPDRFYISHTPLGAPAIATGVDEVDSEALKVRKIIHNDQLYIIRGGQLYDATGKVVK